MSTCCELDIPGENLSPNTILVMCKPKPGTLSLVIIFF